MTDVPTIGGPSPWGRIESTWCFVRRGELLAIRVTTSSHGGIWVAPSHRHGLAAIETAFSKGGWFEEDCDWALPYVELGLAFYGPVNGPSYETAAFMVKWYHPREWADRLRAEGREGYDTGRAGHYEDSCPYTTPEDRAAWQAGWLDGREALFEGTCVGVLR